MIRIKHLFDAVEPDEGERLWIEPIGLTSDLREWCQVDHVVSNLGPPRPLWEWFEEHPDGYEYFRGQYHEHLAQLGERTPLVELAAAGLNEDYTLVHQGDDPNHNTATALYEFLSELQGHVKP